MARLVIYAYDHTSANPHIRCEVEKWRFDDRYMESQNISMDIKSAFPIDFAVGDYCEFRGETYTLNYKPSCTQQARPGTNGSAFTYENVIFNSHLDDLTRCLVLDVVLTSDRHSAAYGTNYTGSGNFTLNCFGTTFEYQGQTIYYCAAHALVDCILANLIRLYGTTDGQPYDGTNSLWTVEINDEACITDDYTIQFSNWTVAQALSELHNTFKLDYTVRGRRIVVGENMTDITDDGEGNMYYFGYGKGYASETNEGKSLFRIKRTADSSQNIITRLRAVGSTRNMPYNYYFKNYSLPQTMFLQNLQLPQTFLTYDGSSSVKPEGEFANKVAGNQARDAIYGIGEDGLPNVRHVLGDSNDAYIDKNDDAASCDEGVREASARWDGSDSELPEIYPTIKEGTYSQLRGNNVPDMDKTTGVSAFPNYLGNERIDEILALGEHVNYGDGKLADRDVTDQTEENGPVQLVSVEKQYNSSESVGSITRTLFTSKFAYEASSPLALSYTTDMPKVTASISMASRFTSGYTCSAKVWYVLHVYEVPMDGSPASQRAMFTSVSKTVNKDGTVTWNLPDFNNAARNTDDGEWTTDELRTTTSAKIQVTIEFRFSNVTFTPSLTGDNLAEITYAVTGSGTGSVTPEYQLEYVDAQKTYKDTPFYLILKDNGIEWDNITLLGDEKITITMQSGQCAGVEFDVLYGDGDGVERTTVGGKKGWKIKLSRNEDSSIYAYYPSENRQILAGDTYIVTGLLLPNAYIRAAETRLLEAATAYLADNSETKFTYQPDIDDIYLQRNIDRNDDAGTPEKSIFWNLYAGLKFPFFGIPEDSSEDADLPICDITIQQVSITMGEKVTPQVEIVLNENIEQTTLQKIQISIDRIYNSAFGGASVGGSGNVNQSVILSLIRTQGKKLFLSKVTDDVAQGNIGFAQNISVTGTASVEGELSVTGTSDFDGDEEHRGVEVHYGHETHNGEESHTNYETHTGDEEHGGNVNITKNLSIDEGAIAEILGTMFFGNGEGFVSGLNGNGGKIDSEASAELKDLFVRELTTIVRGIFNELVSSHPTSKVGEWFQQGFNGHGTKIWYDNDTGWNMELDTLTVRRIMYIFELVIQKIRSVGGILIVSAANGKIKEVQKVKCVTTQVEYFKITFEDTNNFVRHDLMRCQRWNNGRYDDVTKEDDAELPDSRAMQYYWVEVAFPDSIAFNQPPVDTPDDLVLCDDNWNVVTEGGNEVDADFSTAYDILVPRSEFGKTVTVEVDGVETTIPADTEPQVGDDCVLMGNTQYTKRQNYIYISATEDGVPRIDVMDSCNSKGDGGNLRCRLGCLDGINDSYWGLEQPSGYGLYSDNAWLKGKFIIRIGDRDRDVSTMFEVLDGMIRSSVSSLREDTIGGEGCISNNVFTEGLDKWGIYGSGQLLTDGTKALHDGTNLLSFFGFAEYVKLVDDNGTFAVEMKGSANSPRGIIQHQSDMHDVPTFEEDANDEPIARAFAVSFYAKADAATSVTIGIGGTTFTIMVSASSKFKKYVHTLDISSVGDFSIYTYGGPVQVRGIVVSVDIDQAMIDRLVSRIEQIPDSITGIVEAFEEVNGSWQLKEFASFKLGYNLWQTSVANNFDNTNSKISQLSDSITSSVKALVPITENDYIYDPTIGGGLDYISKWNITENTSSKHLTIGVSGGEKYVDIMNDSAETPVGFYPSLKNVPQDAEVNSKSVEICLSVRCMASGTIVVRQDTTGGNTEEIYRKSLTSSTTYELVRFAASWKFGNIYVGVLGANAQMYIDSVCMADDGKAVMAELSSRITQTQNSITSTVQAAVSSATETISNKITTLEQTADGITARVDANSGNRIFSRLTSDFDYYDAECSFEPEDMSEYIYEYTKQEQKVLCINGDEGSDTSDWSLVKLGLLPTAKEYDGEKITIVIKAFAELQASGRIRIRYGSESNDYVDVTNAFSQPIGVDGWYEVTAEINTFHYNYGIKIGVWGDGTLELLSVVGLVEARSSIIKQTSESILQAVADDYVSSSSLSDLVSAYLTTNGYATNSDISTAVSGMMTTNTFNSIFSAYYDPNTGEYTIAAAISTSVKYTVVDGQKIMQGDVAISASNIHLEGYTTINDGFSVDEEGNATMNDCTVAGVINNLAQVINVDNAYKYFAWGREGNTLALFLDATKVSGAVILCAREFVPAGQNPISGIGENFSGKHIWLPSVRMRGQSGERTAYHAGANINDEAGVDTGAGSPISMKSMRMLIGKKLTLYLDGDTDAVGSLCTIHCNVIKYGGNDWGETDNLTIGSGHCLVAECKMIQINNHEAIGWEITEHGSIMLFDSDF